MDSPQCLEVTLGYSECSFGRWSQDHKGTLTCSTVHIICSHFSFSLGIGNRLLLWCFPSGLNLQNGYLFIVKCFIQGKVTDTVYQLGPLSSVPWPPYSWWSPEIFRVLIYIQGTILASSTLFLQMPFRCSSCVSRSPWEADNKVVLHVAGIFLKEMLTWKDLGGDPDKVGLAVRSQYRPDPVKGVRREG